jgi:hypothetical protein
MNNVYEIIRKRNEEYNNANDDYNYDEWELDVANDIDGVTMNSKMDIPELFIDGVKVIQNKAFESTEIIQNSNNMANIESIAVKNLTTNDIHSTNIKTNHLDSINDTLSIKNDSIIIDNQQIVKINKHIDNTPNDIKTRILYCDGIVTNNIVMNGYLNIVDSIDDIEQPSTSTINNTISYQKLKIVESNDRVSIYNNTPNSNLSHNLILYDSGTTRLNCNKDKHIEFTESYDTNPMFIMRKKNVINEGNYSVFESMSNHSEIGSTLNPFNVIYSKSFAQPSSRALKENITKISSKSLKLIMQMKPHMYNYKDNVNDRNAGFILEEIQDIALHNNDDHVYDMVNSILYYDKNNDAKCISNNSIVAIAISAIQTQQIQLDIMKNQMNVMQKQIDNLMN